VHHKNIKSPEILNFELETPKKQIELIIGQWINGEQDGYCFGFEGPPGVGKTSLAKNGLANCLKDSNGQSRPFAMIQMGGDSNGSTLHGHNYTYVGSTWGSIVQILMDKKCMNPIIFIDEVDKISKTEHGREIVGILTHLLDSTQNDCFQDKYFAGVDFDLSKALFILSYNDVFSIDKVLLDRIHRIKFDPLSLEDKIIIVKKHLLPDIYEKMGLENVIEINDKEIKFIIEKLFYTIPQHYP
jgi:ATP-dependent Lon protease